MVSSVDNGYSIRSTIALAAAAIVASLVPTLASPVDNWKPPTGGKALLQNYPAPRETAGYCRALKLEPGLKRTAENGASLHPTVRKSDEHRSDF